LHNNKPAQAYKAAVISSTPRALAITIATTMIIAMPAF